MKLKSQPRSFKGWLFYCHFFAALLLVESAVATKPCPSSPCFDSSNIFLKEQCGEAASWIAVGTVAAVVHDKQGHPLNKDFAKFVLKISRWEKSSGSEELSLAVTWCSPELLPQRKGAQVRVYGAVNGDARSVLAFEALE